MPIGNYALVSHVIHDLVTVRPQRVLDLGIGFGFYGSAVRQWLDFGVQPWRTHLVGVEGWAGYSNPLWDLYDVLVVDSIQNYLQRHHDQFDWILMTDVLEHFEMREGRQVIETLKTRVAPGGHLVIGTPAFFFEQGAVYGNAYETHRSIWRATDLAELGFVPIMTGDQPDEFGHLMVLAVWVAP